MARSVWKGPFVDASLLKCTSIHRRIWSRRSCILPQFVGSSPQLYNGRSWVSFKITEDMVGHKFGEFVSTRRIVRTLKSSKKPKQKPNRK